MKPIPAFLLVLLSAPALLSLSACNKSPSPTPKPLAQPLDSSAQAAATPQVEAATEPPAATVQPVSVAPEAEDSSFGGFDVEEAYFVPWEDESAPMTDTELSEDSALALADAFRENRQKHDTIEFYGPERDTLNKVLQAELDFRVCGGSHNFSTLRGKDMPEAMLLGSAPRPGLTYQILGKGGEAMQAPLRFDSMQVNVFSGHDNHNIKVPVWRGSVRDSSLAKTIGALKGKAMIIGSRLPLRNAAVRPAPISDSVKLLILRSLVAGESKLAMFPQSDFYSAGADGARMRCVVLLGGGMGNGPMYVVEVANGMCEVLFRVNSTESKTFLYPLSLTESPVADVFVIRIYETARAFLKKNGKWTYADLEYNDPYNWGC